MWSKIGHLNPSIMPKVTKGNTIFGSGASPGIMSCITGRLLCDTFLCYRDLLKEVSYSLTDSVGIHICFTTVERPEDGSIPRLPSSRKMGVLPEGTLQIRLVERWRMVKSWLKTATRLKVQQLDIQQQALKLTANSCAGRNVVLSESGNLKVINERCYNSKSHIELPDAIENAGVPLIQEAILASQTINSIE